MVDSIDDYMAEKEDSSKYYKKLELHYEALKEKDPFAHLKGYESKQKKAHDIIRLTERIHREAFNEYERHFLTDDGEGVDPEKAKDGKLRNKAVHAMMDIYLGKVKKKLKIKDKTDEFENALLTNLYANVTVEDMKILTSEDPGKFTFDDFYKHMKEKLTPQLAHKLFGAARSHLNDTHIEDIVKYTKMDKIGVDHTRLNYAEAMEYLEEYRQNKVIAPKSVKEIHQKPEYIKKQQAKKKKEDEKSKENIEKADKEAEKKLKEQEELVGV